jgi:hypothetical protein
MPLNYRDLLDARSLSKSDKQAIEVAYRSAFGRDMPNKNSSCRSCYNDALALLINAEKRGAYLRAGVVVKHNGKLYNSHSELPYEVIELYRDKLATK